MNPVFEILPENILPGEINLFLEVKNDGLSYFFEHNEDKMIKGLSVYHFDKSQSGRDTTENLRDIFTEQPLLQKTFKKIKIVYAFDESVLIPSLFYKDDLKDEALDIIYGDLNQSISFSDIISDKMMYNVYRVPSAIHKLLYDQYPLATFVHQYSLIIKKLSTEGDLLQVIFYQEKIVAVLLKAGSLQIIQSFCYKTAEDVVYYLLNLVEQFEVENIPLEINGMIEKDSPLLKEIHKYFLNISFNDFNTSLSCAEKIKEYPSHYFSHLFYMASCV